VENHLIVWDLDGGYFAPTGAGPFCTRCLLIRLVFLLPHSGFINDKRQRLRGRGNANTAMSCILSPWHSHHPAALKGIPKTMGFWRVFRVFLHEQKDTHRRHVLLKTIL
jgi:hypothetical protein